VTTTVEAGEGELARNYRQIKSRDRVRDLAEVYTHEREVDAMLDLVVDMFPSDTDPQNTDRKFLEPACGSGNFLEAILRRKLAHTTARRYGRGERYEHRILRCLASIYGIDISRDNVLEARDRMRAAINSHLDNDLNTQTVSDNFAAAVEVILATNIVHADTLADAGTIELIDYQAGKTGTFTREWSFLDPAANKEDLFSLLVPRRDEAPIHYAQLADHPGPLLSAELHAEDNT
jgi:SAM-dependent methyltransferase